VLIITGIREQMAFLFRAGGAPALCGGDELVEKPVAPNLLLEKVAALLKPPKRERPVANERGRCANHFGNKAPPDNGIFLCREISNLPVRLEGNPNQLVHPVRDLLATCPVASGASWTIRRGGSLR